ASNALIDGKLQTNGPITVSRPDGSVKIGHGSSIIELIGADPFIFPLAPHPSVFFSKSQNFQLGGFGPSNPAVPLPLDPQLVLTADPSFTTGIVNGSLAITGISQSG